MKNLNTAQQTSKHEWYGSFLSGRFKLKVRFSPDKRVIISLWQTENPREVKMSRKTRKRFDQEYGLFMQDALDCFSKLSGENIVVMDGGGKWRVSNADC